MLTFPLLLVVYVPTAIDNGKHYFRNSLHLYEEMKHANSTNCLRGIKGNIRNFSPLWLVKYVTNNHNCNYFVGCLSM